MAKYTSLRRNMIRLEDTERTRHPIEAIFGAFILDQNALASFAGRLFGQAIQTTDAVHARDAARAISVGFAF